MGGWGFTSRCIVPSVNFGSDVVSTDVPTEIKAHWLVVGKFAIHLTGTCWKVCRGCGDWWDSAAEGNCCRSSN